MGAARCNQSIGRGQMENSLKPRHVKGSKGNMSSLPVPCGRVDKVVKNDNGQGIKATCGGSCFSCISRPGTKIFDGHRSLRIADIVFQDRNDIRDDPPWLVCLQRPWTPRLRQP
jgi:hypothetical protein